MDPIVLSKLLFLLF